MGKFNMDALNELKNQSNKENKIVQPIVEKPVPPHGKTIKQLSDELGITKQALQQRLRREPLCTEVEPFVHTYNGVKYIGVAGEILVKKAFSNSDVHINTKQNVYSEQPKKEDLYTPVDSLVDTLISMLQKELEIKNQQLLIKDQQLGIKDKQIEELTQTIKLQAESINADRKNELAETLIDGQHRLLEKNNNKKEHWWNRKDK